MNNRAARQMVRLGDVAEIQTGRAIGRQNDAAELMSLPYLSLANELNELAASMVEIARRRLAG